MHTALRAAHHWRSARLCGISLVLGAGRAIETPPKPDGSGNQGNPEQQTEHGALFFLADGQFSQGRRCGAADKACVRRVSRRCRFRRRNMQAMPVQSCRAIRYGALRWLPGKTTRTFSQATKNPPKRVFLRPFRHPVSCLLGDGRSSLILLCVLLSSDVARLVSAMGQQKSTSQAVRVSLWLFVDDALSGLPAKSEREQWL